MKVTINGQITDAASGTTVEQALKRMGEPDKGCILSVRKKVAVEKVATDLFRIETTRGSLIIRIDCQRVFDGWRGLKIVRRNERKILRGRMVFGQ